MAQKPTIHLRIHKLPFLADWKIRYKLWRMSRGERSHTWMLMPMALACAFLIVAIPVGYAGVSSYAYDATNITRGDWLYSMRRSREIAHLRSLSDPAERAEYYAELSRRRLQEADIALQRHPSFAWLPTAYAQGVQNSSGIQLGDNVVAGLIVESTHFLSRSLQEINRIVQPQIRRRTLETIQEIEVQNSVTIEHITQETPTEEQGEIEEVAIKMHSVHRHYRRQIRLAKQEDEPIDVPLEKIWDKIEIEENSVNAEIDEIKDEIDALEEEIAIEVEEIENGKLRIENEELEKEVTIEVEEGIQEEFDERIDIKEEEDEADEERLVEKLELDDEVEVQVEVEDEDEAVIENEEIELEDEVIEDTSDTSDSAEEDEMQELDSEEFDAIEEEFEDLEEEYDAWWEDSNSISQFLNISMEEIENENEDEVEDEDEVEIEEEEVVEEIEEEEVVEEESKEVEIEEEVEIEIEQEDEAEEVEESDVILDVEYGSEDVWIDDGVDEEDNSSSTPQYLNSSTDSEWEDDGYREDEDISDELEYESESDEEELGEDF